VGRTDDVDVFVEYAGILAAVSLMAITLTGAYGKNVTAVFNTSSVGIAAVAKVAKAQKVPTAGAKTAYKRAPYSKPALRYLYALGWIGGTKNAGQCGLTLLGQDAAREQAAREMRSNRKLVAQFRKRGISVATAARAVTKGVVSACA
jgi:hypothetical protein